VTPAAPVAILAVMACPGRQTVVFLVALCVTLAACSRRPVTPEDEIRQMVDEIEEAVRDKDIAAVSARISDRYSDEEDRDKQALKGVLLYFLMQNRSVHLLTRIRSITFPSADTAELTVFTAMAGTQIPDAAILPQIHADIYRFDSVWKKEAGNWRLVEAAWEPATTEDFS